MKSLKYDWNPGKWVLIGKYSVNAFQWIRTWQNSMIFKILWFFVPEKNVVSALKGLTLPMLRLLSSKTQGCKNLWKPSKCCHVGIQWKALAEHYDEWPCARVLFILSGFLHHFVLAKLATSSKRIMFTDWSPRYIMKTIHILFLYFFCSFCIFSLLFLKIRIIVILLWQCFFSSSNYL